MSHRIVPWPNPCLKAKAEPIVKITTEITQIWQDMIVVMEAMPGVGLVRPAAWHWPAFGRGGCLLGAWSGAAHGQP